MLLSTEIFSKRRKIHSCTELKPEWLATVAKAFSMGFTMLQVVNKCIQTPPEGRRADSGGTAIPDRLLTSRTINCLNCTSVDKKSFDHGKDAWSFSKRSNFEEQILHLILAQWAEKRCLLSIRFFNKQTKTSKSLWRPLALVI